MLLFWHSKAMAFNKYDILKDFVCIAVATFFLLFERTALSIEFVLRPASWQPRRVASNINSRPIFCCFRISDVTSLAWTVYCGAVGEWTQSGRLKDEAMMPAFHSQICWTAFPAQSRRCPSQCTPQRMSWRKRWRSWRVRSVGVEMLPADGCDWPHEQIHYSWGCIADTDTCGSCGFGFGILTGTDRFKTRQRWLGFALQLTCLKHFLASWKPPKPSLVGHWSILAADRLLSWLFEKHHLKDLNMPKNMFLTWGSRRPIWKASSQRLMDTWAGWLVDHWI